MKSSFDRLSERDLYTSFFELERKSDRCLVDLSVILSSFQNHSSEDGFKNSLCHSLENGGELYITHKNFEKFNKGISFLRNEIKSRQGYQKRRSKHYVGNFDKRILKTKRKIDLEQDLSNLFYKKKKVLRFKGNLKKDYDLIYSEGLNIESEYKGNSTAFDFLVSGLVLSREYRISLLSNNFGMVEFLNSFLWGGSSKNYNINLFGRIDEDNFERLV